jgi:hypothetical protein
LKKLADAFGVSADELLVGLGAEETAPKKPAPKKGKSK